MKSEAEDIDNFLNGLPRKAPELAEPQVDHSKKVDDVFPILPTMEPSEDQQSATEAALKTSQPVVDPKSSSSADKAKTADQNGSAKILA